MNYDVDYFIRKFEAIPEEKWCVGAYEDGMGRRCAYGHCGKVFAYDSRESGRLRALAFGIGIRFLADINDGSDPGYRQPTPKQRVLAALRDIKAKQNVAA